MKRSFIYVLLVGIMVAWGLNVTALKVLVEHFSPVALTALRILTAGLVVLLFLWGIGKLERVSWKEAKQIGVAALFSVVAHHFFLALGIARTTAVNAGLVLGLVPLVTALLAIVFLGQRPTLFRLLGIALGFFGIVFVVASGDGGLGHLSIGDVYVFLAVLAQGISFIMIKKSDGRGAVDDWVDACLRVALAVCLKPRARAERPIEFERRHASALDDFPCFGGRRDGARPYVLQSGRAAPRARGVGGVHQSQSVFFASWGALAAGRADFADAAGWFSLHRRGRDVRQRGDG